MSTFRCQWGAWLVSFNETPWFLHFKDLRIDGELASQKNRQLSWSGRPTSSIICQELYVHFTWTLRPCFFFFTWTLRELYVPFYVSFTWTLCVTLREVYVNFTWTLCELYVSFTCTKRNVFWLYANFTPTLRQLYVPFMWALRELYVLELYVNFTWPA